MKRYIVTGILLGLTIGWAEAVGPNVGPNNLMLWGQVTTNADGTPITDLSGYEVLICTSTPCNAGNGTAIVKDVGLTATPTTPRVTLGSLAITQGQKYAVVRAYDATGNRGAVSNEVPFVFDNVSPAAPSGLQIQ